MTFQFSLNLTGQYGTTTSFDTQKLANHTSVYGATHFSTSLYFFLPSPLRGRTAFAPARGRMVVAFIFSSRCLVHIGVGSASTALPFSLGRASDSTGSYTPPRILTPIWHQIVASSIIKLHHISKKEIQLIGRGTALTDGLKTMAELQMANRMTTG